MAGCIWEAGWTLRGLWVGGRSGGNQAAPGRMGMEAQRRRKRNWKKQLSCRRRHMDTSLEEQELRKRLEGWGGVREPG